MKSFEEYLRDDVWEPEGVLDDDMPDAFESWLEGIDVNEIMEYAEDYGLEIWKKAYITGEQDAYNEVNRLASNPN